MAVITIVGTGPGPLRHLIKETERELLSADKIFFRMSQHPVYDWLKENGKQLVSFDTIYTLAEITFTEIYDFIARALVTEATQRDMRSTRSLAAHPCWKTPRDSSHFRNQTIYTSTSFQE